VDVGLRLRAVRLSRRRTLKEVAEEAGVSEGFLSQIELGRSNASIATLRRIAGALGISLSALFDEQFDAGPHLTRAVSQPSLAFGVLGRKYLINTNPSRSFDVLVCEFQPGGSTGDEPYTHGDSEELAMVLTGSVRFQVGDYSVVMAAGDSITYRSSAPHRIEADPATGAKVLFVACPPSF
jgi:transcriptional regulator with XRE-family HTH domain